MARTTRRNFLAGSAASAALLGSTARSYARIQGANERLLIAVAGCGGRGGSHVGGWLGQKYVEIAYVADPDQAHRESKANTIKKKTGGAYETKAINDIRRALDDKNLNAMSIATPNHWHSLLTIWGAQAGKNVYVEKPMSHDIYEGRVVVEAQKKYGVVIQHGTQRRSDAKNAGLHQAIRDRKWGKMKISYGYACKPRNGIGHKPFSDPPANLDWNLWRGPAKYEKFHANLVHYNWHWFWKSGNGELNNQGTHQLDMARWAIDEDQTSPVRAMAVGGRFLWDDQGETPNTLFGIAEYPNGQYLFFNVRNVNYKGYKHQVENEYYFEDGGKIVRGQYYAKGSDKGEKVNVPPGKVTPGGNWGAFIAACRAGKPEMANGNAHDGHYGSVAGHLMNNSWRLGKKEKFIAKPGRFGDNKDAYEHFMKLHEMMVGGIGLPKDGAEYVVGPWLTFDPKTERFTGEHADRANVLVKDPHREGFDVPAPDKV